MKKKRKKKGGRRERLLGLCLFSPPPPLSLSTSISSVLLSLCVEVLGCNENNNNSTQAKRFSFPLSSLNCTPPTTCTYDLAVLHESSPPVCVDTLLAHSCCGLEVHEEELQRLGSGRWRGRGPGLLRAPPPVRRHGHPHPHGRFLQVSPLIPHRQGFRAH